jgi:PhnB protein
MVQPIPAGYHSVTPYLLVRGAAKALDWYAQALGARELMRFPLPGGGIAHAGAVVDQFYGDRSGTLVDPFGHVWTIATHKEDVSAEEAQRRMKALSSKNAG